MTSDAQRLGDYLAHILEAIERIEEYVSDMDELTFLQSKLDDLNATLMVFLPVLEIF